MTSERSKRLLFLSLIVILFMGAIPGHALAQRSAAHGTGNASLMQFVRSVTNGEEMVTGVIASGLFAYPVVQQAADDTVSLSKADDLVTQFRMAARLGNVGLLAHNYLAGESFHEMMTGQRVYLIYGTGRVEAFIVTRILRYQALTPTSAFSDFRELGGTTVISASEMFQTAYGGQYHVTFQTCIERNGESSWGRLFVIAEPVPSTPEHGTSTHTK